MQSFLLPIPSIKHYNLLIEHDGNKLTSISYSKVEVQISTGDLLNKAGLEEDSINNDFEKEIESQISQYFFDSSFRFSLPYSLDSFTHFQQRVLMSLSDIPVGEVVSYGELAQHLSSGARAVANACRQNKYPIIIPCHRVVSKQGLGGYDGDSYTSNLSTSKVRIKEFLLKHESTQCPG